MIHISQICEKRITKPEEVLKIGQKVNAKIISIDVDNKKIELSIRELEGTSDELEAEKNGETAVVAAEEKSLDVQEEKAIEPVPEAAVIEKTSETALVETKAEECKDENVEEAKEVVEEEQNTEETTTEE